MLLVRKNRDSTVCTLFCWISQLLNLPQYLIHDDNLVYFWITDVQLLDAMVQDTSLDYLLLTEGQCLMHDQNVVQSRLSVTVT